MKNTFKTILFICSTVISLSLATYCQTGTTQYIYDDNGRLTAVILPSGETSIYNYDAAGNIISVTRQYNSIVLISSFVYSQPDCQTDLNSKITIRGFGFIAGLNQNAVSFSGAAGTIISATQNEIVASIPQSFTSGNISVSNSNGIAEKYFGINSVNSNVIIPNNPSQSVNLESSGQILSLCFEGTQNKNISLLLENSDLNELEVKITSPSGNDIVAGTYTSVNRNIFIDSSLLTENGRYDVKISSAAGQTGSFDLSLFEFNDLSTTIAPDGAPASISIVYPGQNAKFLFSSTGTSYKLDFADSATSNYSIDIIRNSDGQVIREITALPALISVPAGDYTILFNPSGFATGNVSLKLRMLNSILTDGTPETVNLTSQDQFVGLTFSALAGQTFNLRASNITVHPSYVGVLKPDGETLTSDFIYPWTTGTTLRFTVLENGVYTVTLSPFFPNSTGSATFSLNLLNDVNDTLIINNPVKTFTSTLPGQSFRLSFAGNRGQRFYLRGDTQDFYFFDLSIIKPDGTELVALSNYSPNNAIDINNLPQTGNYTIIIQPAFNHQFGNLQLRAIDNNAFISNNQNDHINAYFYSAAVTDFSGNYKIKDTASSNPTNQNKENHSESANLSVPTADYFYEGTANEQFSFTPNQGGGQPSFSFAGGTMNIYKPDGTILDSEPLGFGICNITLPEAGIYRVEVVPEGRTQSFIFARICGGGGSGGGPSLHTINGKKRMKKNLKSN